MRKLVGLNGEQNTPEVRFFGAGETLFLRNPDDSPRPWIASGYEISQQGDSVRITIRDDIEFQGGFGALTAEDVAWSMNLASQRTNPGSQHPRGFAFAERFKEWKAVDSNTVEFEFGVYNSDWIDELLNQTAGALTVFSKSAYETMGEAHVTENVIATGPYEVITSVEGRLEVSSRYADGGSHYLADITPETEYVTFIESESTAVRASMLKNGTVDAAGLPPSEGADVTKRGFGQASTGIGIQLGIFFAGNLWEKTSAIDGTELTRSTYATDYAWIGDPDNDADMEEARLVRKALAISIDRQAINEQIVGGVGSPVHVTYFSTAHPNWDSKWEYPHDPVMADDILTNQVTGNYFRGTADLNSDNLGGNAFEMSLFVGPELGGANSITGAVALAVADGWAQLGLSTTTLTYSYQAWRPGLTSRFNTDPWITSCDLGRESRHWHAPKGKAQTSLTRDAFGCGFEAPEIVDFYTRMANATDMADASEAATEYLDFVYHWNLQPGVVNIPYDIYYDTSAVDEWPMSKSIWSDVDSVWDLKMR